MDNSVIDNEIKNNKIKQGMLDKRSKFLGEWRERWVVLTPNYIFTFKTKAYVDPTDILETRTIKSYKSYLKHYEDRESCAFKISSDETEMYFRCKGAPEKWSWIVALERLMDYRNNGKSTYNDAEAIRYKGFDSVYPAPVPSSSSPSSPTKKPDPPKVESVPKIQPKLEQKPAPPPPPPPPPVQTPPPPPPPKPQPKPQPKPEPTQSGQQGKNVSALKQMYQKKISQQAQLAKTLGPQLTLPTSKSNTEVTQQAVVHQRRINVVQGVFGEFENTRNVSGFRTYLEFLVDVAANKETGYAPYVVYETKNNKTRKTFAEFFVENYTEEVTEKQAQAMLNFLLVAYYESPGLFELNQVKHLKKTVLKFIGTYKNETTLILAMKALVMLNTGDKYDTESVRPYLTALNQIEQSKNEEARGMARKVKELSNL